MRVLVIEDDKSTAATLVEGIKEHGADAHSAFDGVSGYRLAVSGQYDVIVTDWMMPKMDGVRLVECLRADNIHTPVLMLSAKDDVSDLVASLDAGSDDYLTKPYSLIELMARVRVLYKRSRQGQRQLRDIIELGGVALDSAKHTVTREGQVSRLNPREFRLLSYLMLHANEPLTKDMLLKNVWEYDFNPQTNVVEVHISRLRNKVDKGFEDKRIATVRGVGYVFECKE